MDIRVTDATAHYIVKRPDHGLVTPSLKYEWCHCRACVPLPACQSERADPASVLWDVACFMRSATKRAARLS
jgi:hypothetical protein